VPQCELVAGSSVNQNREKGQQSRSQSHSGTVPSAKSYSPRLLQLREGKIHPVVAERLPVSEARHAHELLESSAAKGKLVLVP
jgi:NADPH:quinone reductase-like Zn-dependent oxidoreductase